MTLFISKQGSRPVDSQRETKMKPLTASNDCGICGGAPEICERPSRSHSEEFIKIPKDSEDFLEDSEALVGSPGKVGLGFCGVC